MPTVGPIDEIVFGGLVQRLGNPKSRYVHRLDYAKSAPPWGNICLGSVATQFSSALSLWKKKFALMSLRVFLRWRGREFRARSISQTSFLLLVFSLPIVSERFDRVIGVIIRPDSQMIHQEFVPDFRNSFTRNDLVCQDVSVGLV